MDSVWRRAANMTDAQEGVTDLREHTWPLRQCQVQAQTLATHSLFILVKRRLSKSRPSRVVSEGCLSSSAATGATAWSPRAELTRHDTA